MAITDKLTDIAIKIRSYTNKAKLMKLDEMPTEIEEVYSTGKMHGYLEGRHAGYEQGNSDGFTLGTEHGQMLERDAFWNAYTNNNKRTYWRYAFAEQGWVDANFKPPYTIIPTSDARYMFQNTGITSIDETQVDFSKLSNFRDTFYSANSLVNLRLKIKDTATFGANAFLECTSLKNLTIIGTIGGAGLDLSDCTSLSLDSIKSVLDACNKPNANITVTLPSSCTVKDAEGNEFEMETESIINHTPAVKTALEAAIGNKYTILFI
jgi:hypothetical protein